MIRMRTLDVTKLTYNGGCNYELTGYFQRCEIQQVLSGRLSIFFRAIKTIELLIQSRYISPRGFLVFHRLYI